eukprot:NODE_17597_length_934_cov_11.562577.p1 GENE.NODE_17597_length_934_cov_11.562577~~NODE_17597_length_934_cov_11.562577.p1  ORF type:complete len:180 (+),score=44.04 NODE_17597_length_934_cov_11.562577:63-542(+)
MGTGWPAPREFLGECAAVICMYEVFFYYRHRLFHSAWLYKHVHKVHHEITAPTAIVVAYQHPLEYLTQVLEIVLIEAMLSPRVSSTALRVLLFWTVPYMHHSGYEFKFDRLPGCVNMTRMHDFHHEAYTSCYGVLGIMDKFHGTLGAVEQDRREKTAER